MREILAHMSGWQRELTPALGRLSRGDRPIAEGVSYDDVDAWNARFAAAKASWSTADILKELEASHADLLEAGRRVPEARRRAHSTMK